MSNLESENELLVESRSGCLWLTINRVGSKNSLTPDLLRQLSQECQKASADPNCRAVVITGVPGAFSSGYDLRHIDNEEGKSNADEALIHAFYTLENCNIPTIARIDGWCVGAGLELALSCDLRLSTSASIFFLPAASLGIVYPNHGLRRMMDAVGLSTSLLMSLLNERLSATDALRVGLLNAVDDDIDVHLSRWLGQIDRGDRAAIAAMKRAVRLIASDRPDLDADGAEDSGS
jgi:enoyl-CoA hydratase/carnithine racemase